jgi:uncharacterized membrane protein YeaQ/YmgE (transglycosylase-associated protein family)
MPSAADDPAQKPGVARQARAADAADAAADADRLLLSLAFGGWPAGRFAWAPGATQTMLRARRGLGVDISRSYCYKMTITNSRILGRRFGGVMTLDQLLVILLVGLVAGFLASHLVSGHGYGVVGDIVVGIVGALFGAFVLGQLIATVILVPLGIPAATVLADIIVAFIGAAILLAVLRLVTGGGLGRGGRRYSRGRWL